MTNKFYLLVKELLAQTFNLEITEKHPILNIKCEEKEGLKTYDFFLHNLKSIHDGAYGNAFVIVNENTIELNAKGCVKSFKNPLVDFEIEFNEFLIELFDEEQLVKDIFLSSDVSKTELDEQFIFEPTKLQLIEKLSYQYMGNSVSDWILKNHKSLQPDNTLVGQLMTNYLTEFSNDLQSKPFICFKAGSALYVVEKPDFVAGNVLEKQFFAYHIKT